MTPSQPHWVQENEKLKAHGYKWKFAGMDGAKKLWQLYTPEGEPINKAKALAYVAQEEEWEEEARWAEIESRLIERSWHGLYSEAVMMHPDVVSMYQEGDSYVIFPEATKIEEDREPDTQSRGKLIMARYTLPDGTVFLFKDAYLATEQEHAGLTQILQELQKKTVPEG
jgi:hypothetical protein